MEELLGPLVSADSQADAALIPSALFRLGLSRFDGKDWAGSRQALGELQTRFPDSELGMKARFWSAEAAFQGNDADTAERAFRELVVEGMKGPSEGRPEWLATARLRHVESLVALERWQDGLAEADALKMEASAFAGLHALEYARGRCLQGLARFEEARAAYQAVIDEGKADDLAARAQFLRGETYFHEEKYTEALREFLRVDFSYPEQPVWRAAALLEAGKVAEQMGRWSDAADFYEKLAQAFPESERAAEAQERLATVRRKADAEPRRPKS